MLMSIFLVLFVFRLSSIFQIYLAYIMCFPCSLGLKGFFFIWLFGCTTITLILNAYHRIL